MALSSSTTAQVVDAMAAEIAPRTVNPYPNQVIHADIRIQSIDNEPGQNGAVLQNGEPMVGSKPSTADAGYKEQAAVMQEWWTEAVAKNMDLPEGYAKVAVLIVKWADELDELKTGDEVCWNQSTRWAPAI
jgi:hypothetical protein